MCGVAQPIQNGEFSKGAWTARWSSELTTLVAKMNEHYILKLSFYVLFYIHRSVSHFNNISFGTILSKCYIRWNRTVFSNKRSKVWFLDSRQWAYIWLLMDDHHRYTIHWKQSNVKYTEYKKNLHVIVKTP